VLERHCPVNDRRICAHAQSDEIIWIAAELVLMRPEGETREKALHLRDMIDVVRADKQMDIHEGVADRANAEAHFDIGEEELASSQAP
jgi:hypothetical protein